MVRFSRSLVWSVTACVPLALPARADIIETTPADVPSATAAAGLDESKLAEHTATPDETSSEPELIRERFPNGAIRVERRVVQDTSGNYVNHGKSTVYDEKGRTIGTGEYRYGERHGPWTRWHLPGGKDMFAQPPYKNFKAPFVSEANFDTGRLHGTWTIYDAQERKCSEFTFEYGERHGKSVWYYPNGQKMREITFTAGQLDGPWQEWGPNKNLTMNENYDNGRRMAKKTEVYPSGQNKSEGVYLYAREVLKSEYDWWNGTVTTTASKEGKDQRHGAFTSWHQNGQKNEEGHYQNDLPVGKFTWWYATGQKSIEGQFDSGDRDGHWTWWHENGQKAVTGDFEKGVELGKWTWWKEDGKVANSARITQGQSKVVIEQTSPPQPAVVTAQPQPATPKAPVRQARAPRKAPTTNVRR